MGFPSRSIGNDVTLAELVRSAKLRPGDYVEVLFDAQGLWSIKVTRATPALRRMMRSRTALRQVAPNLRSVAMTDSTETVKGAAQGPDPTYEETWDPPMSDCRYCRANIFWYTGLTTNPGEWRATTRKGSKEKPCTNPGGHEPI
jgi:hypothetical protein